MKKTTLLIALFALFAGAAAAEAQVYVRPSCCGTAYGNYYAPTYVVAQQPVYSAGTNACCQGNTRAYYAGNCCGQAPVQRCSSCCHATASPCAGHAVYQPAVTYQPAAYQPAAYGPQPAGCSPYYVRRGLLGQPTVYVPGQPIRNFFRFLSL